MNEMLCCEVPMRFALGGSTAEPQLSSTCCSRSRPSCCPPPPGRGVDMTSKEEVGPVSHTILLLAKVPMYSCMK